MPQWSGSTRRQRLPPDWQALRIAVLQRDGHQCTHIRDDGYRCTNQATDVDHITPGDDHSLPNLRAMCRAHHQRKSSSEGGKSMARVSVKRRPEPPPGVRG